MANKLPLSLRSWTYKERAHLPSTAGASCHALITRISERRSRNGVSMRFTILPLAVVSLSTQMQALAFPNDVRDGGPDNRPAVLEVRQEMPDMVGPQAAAKSEAPEASLSGNWVKLKGSWGSEGPQQPVGTGQKAERRRAVRRQFSRIEIG